ncbi:MAG TPA: inorganic phosphate transporter, partial [Methanocella sp.]|nr:inorganic phosphate transporter [Methanocella sp.]
MVIAILVALVFDVMNGFHDTANSVATVIYTKALPPQVAIGIASLMNIVGPFLLGTAVAKVIATSIIPTNLLTIEIVVGALAGAIVWDLITWYYGIPVSSSHALIGGLVGSGIAALGLGGIKWGGLTSVITALLVSPIVGIVLGMVFMFVVGRFIIARIGHEKSEPIFKRVQILSSACVSLTHGSNDA